MCIRDRLEEAVSLIESRTGNRIDLSRIDHEDSDVYEGVNPGMKRQLCVESYQLQIFNEGIDPNQDLETININSHGFRGQEVSLQKPENTFRIFGVGGSTMMGSGSLSDVTTITGYLQNEFNNLNLQYNRLLIDFCFFPIYLLIIQDLNLMD